MQVGKDTFVSIHYQVSTGDGNVVDRSQDREPLSYLHGHGQIIPGLESNLEGAEQGQSLEAEVPPEQAYGERDPHLDLTVPLDAFPEEVRGQLEPGFRFRAEHPNQSGEDVVYQVAQVGDDQVLVSGNHPLAGETLRFEVEVVEVREASEEEKQQAQAQADAQAQQAEGQDEQQSS